MKKRRLPIPLILLIPIVMLIIVAVAGIYRFSLSDEEILAKFPSQQQAADPILKAIFDLSTPNPWTVEVPNTHAFSFINQYDEANQVASGNYDAGAERGSVSINIQWLTQLYSTDYVSALTVSNQGSGVFTYAAYFYYDRALKRMVLKDSELLGDRVVLQSITLEQENIRFEYLSHGVDQSMAQVPTASNHRVFALSNKGKFQPAD
ncbi:hypothetical protein NL53_17790 [Vibrio variabilis]|uniref:Uncharacterized protein n=1 Tax=Vibrio variabilis TaxID=990271 RepID=A0ABR4Y6W0_9VIBR|nr:hypothetical protein [Vibrio variabilis]KHA59192.1 hypothetical protein NL53_17790 [Vibrio variabilis]